MSGFVWFSVLWFPFIPVCCNVHLTQGLQGPFINYFIIAVQYKVEGQEGGGTDTWDTYNIEGERLRFLM